MLSNEFSKQLINLLLMDLKLNFQQIVKTPENLELTYPLIIITMFKLVEPIVIFIARHDRINAAPIITGYAPVKRTLFISNGVKFDRIEYVSEK